MISHVQHVRKLFIVDGQTKRQKSNFQMLLGIDEWRLDIIKIRGVKDERCKHANSR